MLSSSTTVKVDDAGTRRQTKVMFQEGLLTEQGSRYLGPEVRAELNNAVALVAATAIEIGVAGGTGAHYV